MKEDRALEIAAWLGEHPPYVNYYWEVFTTRELMEAWFALAGREDWVAAVGRDRLENFLWHAGHLLGDVIWREDVDTEVAAAAIRASRVIIEMSCAAAEADDWLGAYMFWENLLGGRVSGERGDQLWRAARDTLRALEGSSDPLVVESTRHGREHFDSWGA